MPQAINSPSWSSSHVSRSPRTPRHPPPSKKPPTLRFQLPMSRDNVALASPRAASLTGKKRPRESDAERESTRRTRSVGELREARDREAFQRQLIGVFVPRALKESAEGNLTNYNDLLSHFLPTPTQPIVPLAPLLPLVRALTAHVSLLLPRLHNSLITAIVSLPWATGDERFVKSYVGLFGVIVSAHPEWTKEIVTMAVKGLTWQSPTSVPSTITRRDYHARHHLLLSHLLSLVPTLPNVLQPLLNKYAPHKREAEVVQTTWVRNCCELIDYCPELGARVWSSLVDRMLRIDVEITNRLEDDEDDDDDDDDDIDPSQKSAPSDPFELFISQDVPKERSDDDDEDSDDDDEGEPDPDALSSDDENSDDEDEHDLAKLAAARAKKREVLRTMRSKLDGMLCYFLRYLEQAMGARERGPSAAEMAAQSLVSNSGSSTPRAGTPRPGTPTVRTPTELTAKSAGSSAPNSASPALATRPPPNPAQSLAHFQTLLNLFSRQILPTSSTQHLPFVIFMCSSFSAAHTELFLHLLVLQSLYARINDAPSFASQPVSLSQRAAATVYIGSLVCRARFVTDEQARTVMGYLLAYVDGKLHAARTQKNDPELPLFYAVCQAAMLIFCFRWRAFTSQDDMEVTGEMDMDESTGGQWISDLDVLQRAITSELNPLLGCNPNIVSTFAKVANATNFAYCFSIMEANQNAHRIPSASSLNASQPGRQRTFTRTQSVPNMPTQATSSNIAIPKIARQVNVDAGLDDYFPFDPYDLPLSGEFIEHLYRTWDDVAVDLGGDSDSDEDDEEDGAMDTDEDDEEDLPEGRLKIQAKARQMPKDNSSWHRHRDLLDGGISTSFETMNLSPRFSGASGVTSEA